MQQIKNIEKNIKHTFKDQRLITEAITHKSYKKPYNYERLEFLGDAVLDLVVGEYLFTRFFDKKEGDLSKLRAAIVSKEGFTRLAYEIELNKNVLISESERANGGQDKPTILSSSFEAVVGALYLDSGLKKVEEFVLDLIEETYESISLKSLSHDHKTQLQEITQIEYGCTPTYEVSSENGPDHKKNFEVSLYINEELISKGYGGSKKIAEQDAAKRALEILENKE